MKTETVADMKKVFKKAKEIIRKEPEYVHNSFSRLIGNANCYCTIGAVGKAIGGKFCRQEGKWIRIFGWNVRYFLESRLRSNRNVRATLHRLSDPTALVDKKQSLKALTLLSQNILTKTEGK